MASASFRAVETVRPARMLLPENGVMKHATDIRMTGTALNQLYHEGAFDLVPGLRSLDEGQAGIHGNLGDAAARQAGSRNELRQRRIYKGAGGSSKCLLQSLPPLAWQSIGGIRLGKVTVEPL